MEAELCTSIRNRSTNYFRKKRAAQFQKLFPDGSFAKAIDLGGSPQILDLIDYRTNITLMNLDQGHDDGKYGFIVGDARDTGLPNDAFGLAFSNSAIEHVGTLQDQMRMAAEMRRIAKKVYCQTPARWSLVEPHFIAPYVHWLPWFWKGHTLIRYCSLFGLTRRPHPCNDLIARLRDGIRYVSKMEMKLMFPDCVILTERFLGWPKAYIAVRSF